MSKRLPRQSRGHRQSGLSKTRLLLVVALLVIGGYGAWWWAHRPFGPADSATAAGERAATGKSVV